MCVCMVELFDIPSWPKVDLRLFPGSGVSKAWSQECLVSDLFCEGVGKKLRWRHLERPVLYMFCTLCFQIVQETLKVLLVWFLRAWSCFSAEIKTGRILKGGRSSSELRNDLHAALNSKWIHIEVSVGFNNLAS